MKTTDRYYRLQPTGLPIQGHETEDSAGQRTGGIDVFLSIHETLAPDCDPASYGDEVLVIEAEAGSHWDNGDVEGVRIDADSARVVARVGWDEWIRAWEDVLGGEHNQGARFIGEDGGWIYAEDSDADAVLAALGLSEKST